VTDSQIINKDLMQLKITKHTGTIIRPGIIGRVISLQQTKIIIQQQQQVTTHIHNFSHRINTQFIQGASWETTAVTSRSSNSSHK